METVRVPEIAKIKPRVDGAWKSQCTDGKAVAKMTMADNASMCIVGAKYGGKQEKEAALNEAAEVIVAAEEGYLEIAAQEEAEKTTTFNRELEIDAIDQEIDHLQEDAQASYMTIQVEYVNTDNTDIDSSLEHRLTLLMEVACQGLLNDVRKMENTEAAAAVLEPYITQDWMLDILLVWRREKRHQDSGFNTSSPHYRREHGWGDNGETGLIDECRCGMVRQFGR